ncbi:transmembrane protein 268 isoform X3 [Carcharodon carcharias]|uniref:transmembrane protein 268 isoform X3 n=1 Tax=Carcharodon carcharias TaxID=13397 RepID=UPI001B7ED45B|nr:transmembrane protein 268 isoform X3 [Carcharodon carcharias]
MACNDNGYKISPARASLTSFEAVEEADVIHWINDPNGPGTRSRSNSINGSELQSSPSERPELYNGRMLLDLTSSGFWWSQGFDLESCVESLARFGVQVPPEDYELPIQVSLMNTEVRRYMYFSSTGFMMLLAPVFYLAAWCCLFSTFHLYLGQYVKSFYWAFCLLISVVAILLTTVLLLLLHRHHQKCLLNQKLGHLCIVIETNQVSPLNNMQAQSEETPLLSGDNEDSRSNGNQQTQHVFNTLTCLVPKGTAQEIAYQLLVTYSGLYVKLLATQQLPCIRSSIHAKDANVPCLCQYIETSILNLSSRELK